MPLGLDPDQTTDVWLKSDAPKPLETRPTFQFKFLTVRELRKVQELRQAAREQEDNDKCDQMILEALMIGLRGWKNMGLAGVAIPYEPTKLDEICTLDERWELLNDYPSAVINSESQRANFPSPSPSPSDNSAKVNATAEGTNVPASPASPSPLI